MGKNRLGVDSDPGVNVGFVVLNLYGGRVFWCVCVWTVGLVTVWIGTNASVDGSSTMGVCRSWSWIGLCRSWS